MSLPADRKAKTGTHPTLYLYAPCSFILQLAPDYKHTVYYAIIAS